MTRWVISLVIVTAMLANGFAIVRCKPAAAASTWVSADEEVPECCRHGLCPHHAAESGKPAAAKHKAPAPDPNCCTISAADAATMTVLSSATGTPAASETMSIQLTLVSGGYAIPLLAPPLRDISPNTPPPRA
jgi:hypothetical protein